MYGMVTAYVASQVGSRVDIPKPGAPDPDDIVDSGKEGGNWLAQQGSSFWTLVVVGVVALILTKALKNAMIRGVLLGIVLVAIVGAIMTK